MKRHAKKSPYLFDPPVEHPADDHQPSWEDFIGQRNRFLCDLSRNIKTSNHDNTTDPERSAAQPSDQLFD